MTTAQHDRLDPLALRVLRVLFDLAHHSRAAHAGSVARELGITRTLAADAMVRLDRAGLVRAEHARLTMHGLVVAAGLTPICLRSPALVHGRTRRKKQPRSEASLSSLPAWLRRSAS